jgi:hypothetical protein
MHLRELLAVWKMCFVLCEERLLSSRFVTSFGWLQAVSPPSQRLLSFPLDRGVMELFGPSAVAAL